MKIEVIQNKIYEVRGEKVMLDFDIANLYEVETRVFNQAVKRNIESFPKDFMFRLTASEWQEILDMRPSIAYLKMSEAAGPEKEKGPLR